MFVKTPKTATAMALVLSLAAPAPVLAQERPDCAEGVELPCVTDTGAVVETEAELETYIEAFPEEAEAAEDGEGAEEGPEAAADAEPADPVDGADEAVPEPAEAEEPEAAVDPAPVEQEEPTEETVQQPAADEAADDATAAAEDGAPGDGDAVEAEEVISDEAVSDDAVSDDAVSDEAASDDAVSDDTVSDEAASDDAVSDEAAEAPLAEDVTDPVEGDTIGADIPEVESEVAPSAEAEAEGEAEAPVAEGVTDPVEEGTIEAEIPEVESETPSDSADAGTSDAARDDTPPAAAAASDDSGETGEVEEMTVTEETSRSATEEFETAVGEQAEAREEDDDDGLTTLQRVIAAGLAGAAIGAITGQGGEVVSNSGDRLVVREGDGQLRVLRDENALLRQPGARVRTETFDDGSTRTTVLRDDGTEIVTVRAGDGRVLRRTRVLPDGRTVVLFDDTRQATPVDVTQLPAPARESVEYTGDEAALRAALSAAMAQDIGRSFSLRQIRDIREVRELAPEIEIAAINFATGSSAIRPSQAQELSVLGRTLAALIDENPGEVFLVEGHTDAVGDASYNLALSDRRAETVALALTEFFDVPPENLVVQGYGESDLKIQTESAEVQNRRANVRRITPLLDAQTAALR